MTVLRTRHDARNRRLASLLAALVWLPIPTRPGVAEILAALRDGDGSARPQRVQALRELGPAAAGEIAALLSGRNAELGLLNGDERTLLLETLCTWSAEDTLEALLEAQPREPALDDHLGTLRLVGEIGGRRALPAVDSLCARMAPEETAQPLVQTELQRSLFCLMRRDAELVGQAFRMIQKGELRPVLFQPLVRAIGQVPSADGVPVLEWLLGRDKELDRTVLESLGKLRLYGDSRGQKRAARTVHGHLTSIHPELRRQAALSLGSLRDAECVPDLIALLEDADRRVQRAAHWALGRIARLELPASHAAWTRWHEAELDWFDARSADLFQTLGAPETGRVIESIRVLSTHPLHAASVSEWLEALLEHDDPRIVSATCSALAKLDSLGSFPLLVATLDAPHEEVRLAATRCLQALTGTDLGGEPGAWQAWLVPGA